MSNPTNSNDDSSLINVGKSYAAVVSSGTEMNPPSVTVAEANSRVLPKLDLHKIIIVDVLLPLKQHHVKDGMPAIHFTNLELQRTAAQRCYSSIL